VKISELFALRAARLLLISTFSNCYDLFHMVVEFISNMGFLDALPLRTTDAWRFHRI